MDGSHRGSRRGVRLGILALCATTTACGPKVDVTTLPPPSQTLAEAGKRLSGSLSAGALTEMAARGGDVLAALTRSERDALARGYLRFRLDRTAVVTVAVPRGFAPFWVNDLGFTPVPWTLADSETIWSVFRKEVAAGWVGLGVNGLDRTPPAHYVVFLQEKKTGRPLIPRAIEGGSWEVVHADVGVSLTTGVDRPIEDLPASLRGATLLRPAHDMRHSTLLARGRVWKTHVVAGPKPDQVTVSYGAEASKELVWSWRTAETVKASVVRYYPLAPGESVPSARPDSATREVRGESTSLSTPDVLNDPLVRLHRAGAKELEAATAYAYSIGDGTPAGMSPWSVVRTSPARGSDVHLMYMGDPQCGLEGWGKLLAEASRRRPDLGVLLIAGDLVDRGNERTNWDHFFLRAAGVFARLPVMPAIGNHEYLDKGPRLYRAFFGLPANGPEGVDPGLVYSFEYGDVFVAVLDSTSAVTSPAEAARQAEWVDDRLARTTCRWKLVMFHHPLYASHTSRESPALRDAWVPVFDRRGVELVLQGHDHAYLRTYPMRAGRRTTTPGEGTVYVVSVSGDKYYNQDTRDYTEVGFTNVSTYQTIDIDAATQRLLYRAWDVTGKEVDRFSIDRSGAPARLASKR